MSAPLARTRTSLNHSIGKNCQITLLEKYVPTKIDIRESTWAYWKDGIKTWRKFLDQRTDVAKSVSKSVTNDPEETSGCQFLEVPDSKSDV